MENIKLAKEDYEKGIYKFGALPSWDFPFARMYDILDSLCKNYGLILRPYPDHETCGMFDPENCYFNVMDSMILRQYGSNIKIDLYKKADSIFKNRHITDTIPAYYCDKAPSYPSDNDSLTRAFFSNFHIPDTCDFLGNCSTCDFRVLFIVDLKGDISNFEIYHSDRPEFTCIDLIKSNIIQSLKKMGRWLPGELDGRKVISYGDIMINIFRRRVN